MIEPAHVYYESLLKGAMPFQTDTIPEKEWIKEENGWRRRNFREKFGRGQAIKAWQRRARSVLTALNENDPTFIYQLDAAMFYGAWKRAMGAEKTFLKPGFRPRFLGRIEWLRHCCWASRPRLRASVFSMPAEHHVRPCFVAGLIVRR